MRKVYLLSLSIFAAGVLNAQTTNSSEQAKKELNTNPEAFQSRPQMLGADRAPDDIIWQDQFEVSADWVAGGAQADANNNWSIGSTVNGWAFGTTGNMGTTGDFARLQVENPSTITMGPLTLEYQGTIPDLTSVPAPHLEWEQYGARFITRQEIQVSTDGGATWITAGSNADIPPLTSGGGSAYGQPETRRFNITNAIAGNPANVMLRLFWDGDQNGPDMNYIDYGWFVDNVRIVEGHSYDSDIQEAYFRSGVNVSYEFGLEYYQVPTTQLTAIDFAAETINQGGLTHTGVYLQADVDNGGNVFSGTSNTVDIAPSASDSVGTTTQFTPSATGTYDITWEFFGDNADTYAANDQMTDQFQVTDYTYARDNGVQTGSIGNVTSNTGSPMLIGNAMDIFADGVIGALDIKITDDATNAGQLIYGQIVKYDVGLDQWVYQDQTADYEIQNSDLNGFVRVVFNNPVQVFTGDLIIVLAGHYGGSDEVRFGYAQTTDEQTVLGYTAGSADPFSLIEPGAMMVRADMRDFTSISEASNDFAIGQNVPNPFGANSIITYSLEEAAQVSVKFVDAAGKEVKTINQGNQTAGSYTINLDAKDFAEGVYFYTFTIGERQVTKRMVVTK